MKIKQRLAKDLIQSNKDKEVSGRRESLHSGKGVEAKEEKRRKNKRNGEENMKKEERVTEKQWKPNKTVA